MSAQVIAFREAVYRARSSYRADDFKLRVSPILAHDFTFWSGASGRRYVHTIYSLIECPEVPNANIVLVRRTPDGKRAPIQACRVENDVPSLNLAELRNKGALLGASEIHVHLLGESRAQRSFIELDLTTAFDASRPDC